MAHQRRIVWALWLLGFVASVGCVGELGGGLPTPRLDGGQPVDLVADLPGADIGVDAASEVLADAAPSDLPGGDAPGPDRSRPDVAGTDNPPKETQPEAPPERRVLPELPPEAPPERPTPDQGPGTCTAPLPTVAGQSPQTSQPLWVGGEKANYKTGQEVTFLVHSKTSGALKYWVKEGMRPKTFVAQGTIQVQAGKLASIKTKLGHPGFLLIEVEQSGQKKLAGVGIDPLCIRSVAQKPSDFDAFWQGELQKLRNIGLGAQRTEKSNKGNYKLYKIVLDQLDGRKVYAWVTIPTQAGKYPAFLELPPFGTTAISPPEHMHWMEKTIYAKISIHNADLEGPAPNAYKPDNATDHKKNYYKYAIMAGVRMLDYIATLPSYDGKNLVLSGKSQGGGLSMMIAGLDPRVTHISSVVAAFGQHKGYRAGRASGFPHWVYHSDKSGQTQEGDILQGESEYYELAHFAARYKGKAHVLVGYIDTVCPPSTILAAYNQLTGPKELIHGVVQGHDWNAWGENWWPLWFNYLKQLRKSF